MARFDIMPFNEGGTARPKLSYFEMDPTITATGEDTAFRTGNILVLDAAVGDVLPVVDGAANPSGGLHYIAACDSEALFQMNLGHTSPSTAAHRNILVPCWEVNSGTLFVTANVYNNNDTELDLDSGFQIGDTVGFWVDDATTTVDGHKHGLDINATTPGLIIERKLDALGRDSLISGAATVRVVFRHL